MAASRFVIVIPARFASSRYPGKPLAPLRGAGGVVKPLIQWTWERASAVPGASGVWVATDDQRIAQAVTAFGGSVLITSPSCRNGTERCAEAIGRIDVPFDFVVNLQGDAPLTPVDAIPMLVDALERDPIAAMATPALPCAPATLAHLLEDEAQGRVGGTTVVFNRAGHALYFSKRVLPYTAQPALPGSPVHLHLGLYAYRPEALAAYAAAPPSVLEGVEGLEQLRFLDMEEVIKIVPLPPPGWDCIELNNPEDTPAVEAGLAALGHV